MTIVTIDEADSPLVTQLAFCHTPHFGPAEAVVDGGDAPFMFPSPPVERAGGSSASPARLAGLAPLGRRRVQAEMVIASGSMARKRVRGFVVVRPVCTATVTS